MRGGKGPNPPEVPEAKTSPAFTPQSPHLLLSPSQVPSTLSPHRWWLLLWGVLQAPASQGSVLRAQQLPQQLMSPGYPNPYPRGQESITDIEAPEGFAVKLTFQDFDVAPSPDCEQDSVTVSKWGFWRDWGLLFWGTGSTSSDVMGGRMTSPSQGPGKQSCSTQIP